MVAEFRRQTRIWIPAAIIGLVFGAPFSSWAQNEGDFFALQRRIVDLFAQHSSAVVRVFAATEEIDDFGDLRVSQRVGTGFFISRDGHVVTNSSIASQAIRVWVEFDGVQYAADALGHDPETNFSLLKLMSLPPSFSHLPLSGNPDLPPVGAFVISMGCPLELPPSPTFGMVTGHESSFANRAFPVSHARINVPANPGEGGSPVIDLGGRLVGMVVASLPEVNSSYVLPAKAMLRVRDDLLFSGQVQYGWVGFELEERRDRHLGHHIVVQNVLPETPAANAGIMAGDRLLKMGEVEISRADDVRNANFHHRVGDYMAVRIEREGEQMDFSLQLITRPSDREKSPPGTASLGERP